MSFTFEQCQAHATSRDCWIVVSGKVYDVTKYLDEHPGGDGLILCLAGRDATADFDEAGHTKRARALLSEYFIGTCEASCRPGRGMQVQEEKCAARSHWWFSFILVGIVALFFKYTV